MDPQQTKEVLKKLGARIAEFRKIRGLTQELLAERLDIPPTNISRIERGLNNPTYTTLLRICQALSTTLYELTKDL